jgi:replication factor A2
LSDLFIGAQIFFFQSSVYSSADGLNNVSQMILNFLQQPAYL